MKKLFLTLFMFFVLFGIARAEFNYYQYININGTITDSNTNPIQGADVWVVNDTCTIQLLNGDLNVSTDANGFYQLPTFSMYGTNCDVHIHVHKPGFIDVDEYLPLAEQTTNNIVADYTLSSTLKVEAYDANNNPLGIGRVTAGGLSQNLNSNGVAYLPVTSVPVDISYIDDSGVYNNYTHSGVSWDLSSQHTEIFNVKKHADISTSVSSSLAHANLKDQFTVTATFTNGDGLTASATNAYATISFENGCASTTDSVTKQIGTLNGGQTMSISWDVTAESVDNDCTITVTPSGTDADMGTAAYVTAGSATVDVTDNYNVDISSPTSNPTRGDSVTISATVRDVNNNYVNGAAVTANLPNGTTVSLIQNGNLYSYTFTINWDDPLSWNLLVEAAKDGNYGSDTQSFSINAAALNVSVQNVGSIFNRGESVTITANVEYPNGDYVTSGTVTFTDPNGNNVSMTYQGSGIWSSDYTIASNDPVGLWTITINANDGNGNIGSDSTSTQISNQYTVNITSPAGGSNFSKGQDVTITAEVYDIHNNLVSGATVTANDPNGNSLTLTEISNGVYQIDYTTLQTDPSGTWTIIVNAQKDGNSGNDSIDVNLETPAELELGGALGSGITISPNIIGLNMHANVTATIVNDGEADALNVGLSTLEIRENDCSGNDVTNIFTISPMVAINIPGGSSGTIQFEIWSDSATTGNYVVCAVASGTDENSGNTIYSDQGNATFEFDSDGPFYSNEHVNPASGVEYDPNAQYTFYINWTDPHGISEVIFELNGTNYTYTNGDIVKNGDEYSIAFNSLNAGNYTYKWYAIDSLGNQNSTQASTYEIVKKSTYDPTDPSNSLIHLAINGNESDFTGTYGVQTNATGWKDVSIPDGDLYLYLNGSLVSNPDIKTLDVGTYEYKLVFNNSANYADAEITRNVTINKATPTLTLLINGIDGDTHAEPYEDVEFNITSNPQGYVELYVNGTLIDSGNTPLSTIQNFAAGYYNITAVMPETSNYVAVSVTHYLTVSDTQPPQITLTSPAGGSLTGPSVFLNATTDENATCRFGTTSNPTQQMTQTGGTQHSEQLVGLPDGSNTYYVNCSDAVGNTAEVSVTWTVDAISPMVNILLPNETWQAGNVEIKVNATDANGIGSVYYKFDNATNWAQMNLDASGFYAAIFNSTSLSDGNYTLRINATDTVGNENTTETFDITIDNTPPSMIFVSPTSGEDVVRGRNISIDVSVSDSGIGIADGKQCSVLLNGNAIGSITYNLTTGKCAGSVSIPGDTSLGSATLSVEISDDLGNANTASQSINIVNPPTGGGGGGGAPTNAKMILTINENEVSINSGEMVTVNVYVENDGNQYLAGLKMSLSGIPKGNYEFSESTFDLDKGESKTIELRIAPINMLSGDYEINVKASNVIAGDSDSFMLKFTNLKEENATSICSDARNYIDTLKTNGTDVTSLNDDYDTAMSQINAGEFDNAIKTCEGILSFTPPTAPTTPTPTAPGGITGFFIAAGKFTMSNLVWIMLISAVAIIAFLSRRKLIGFFKKPPTPPTEEASGENSEKTDENSEEPKNNIYTIMW